MAAVLKIKPEDVLVRVRTPEERASLQEWRWIDLAQRYVWLFGPAEALRRLNAGAEPPAPKLIAA